MIGERRVIRAQDRSVRREGVGWEANGYGPAMVVYAIVLLVLVSIGLIAAAFLDRRRAREIQTDLSEQGSPRSVAEDPTRPGDDGSARGKGEPRPPE